MLDNIRAWLGSGCNFSIALREPNRVEFNGASVSFKSLAGNVTVLDDHASITFQEPVPQATVKALFAKAMLPVFSLKIENDNTIVATSHFGITKRFKIVEVA